MLRGCTSAAARPTCVRVRVGVRGVSQRLPPRIQGFHPKSLPLPDYRGVRPRAMRRAEPLVPELRLLSFKLGEFK